jgi:hypothetical protein
MRSPLAALLVAIAVLWDGPAAVRAQGPTIAEVLKNAAAYLGEFQRTLSGLVAEETYVQEVELEGKPNPFRVAERRLRSDLLLIKPAGADRYVEFRDVFEVDGQPVRERGDRLAELLRQPWATARAQVSAIINESARYNIGSITRNVNTPVLALQFLDAAFQPRFEFKRATKAREQLQPKGAASAPADGVFRATTEMWAIEYREKKRPTVIRTLNGRALPASGRFWINPVTGAVMMSELVLDGAGVQSTISVSYQSEPLMGMLVPVAMTETYRHSPERVVGTATYGRFRRLAP